MLLGLIIEKVTGMELSEAVKKLVFEPLSIDGLFFSPLSVSQIAAPTQFCPYRKKVIMGETHDLNAWAMGGFSGHAGLFGTAGGVCMLLKKLLDIYKGRNHVGAKDFSPLHISEFFKRQDMDKESTWALGFDTPSLNASSAGRYFSANSVGHLGYTGTSFWMDLRNEVIIVFLSNRTFPHDTEESRLAMKRFRPAFHDIVNPSSESWKNKCV
jgi:CubicO group peptidase (beta-lactamase class C family)